MFETYNGTLYSYAVVTKLQSGNFAFAFVIFPIMLQNSAVVNGLLSNFSLNIIRRKEILPDICQTKKCQKNVLN